MSFYVFPLRVEIYPPKHLNIKQGSRAKWTCVASPGHKPEDVNIQWTKIGSNQLPPHVHQQGNQLIIDSVKPEDAGQYRCTGTTTKDIATDESSLTVEAGTPPRPIVTPPFQTVPENGRAVFECIVPGVTGCDIVWHKDVVGGQLPHGVRKYGNKIIIQNARKEHAGNYICTVRTNFGLGESNPGRLDVNREPWRPEADPPVQDVEVGDAARFRCFVRGVPHADFQWRREDGKPFDAAVDQSGGYLTVHGSQLHHAGRYVCTATDPQDPTQPPIDAPAVQLNVRDRAPPRQPLTPQVDPIQQTVDPGQPAKFRCWVEGHPNAQLRWSGRGNRPLPQGARDDRGELVFPSVTQNDAGEFICSVYDPESGKYVDSPPARLDVNQPSSPPLIDPPEQTVQENTPSYIRCWVPGNPNARLSFARRGGQPLPPDAYDDGRGSLRIDRTQTIHEGEYECHAAPSGPADPRNPQGNAPQVSQPARINVRIPEPVPMIPSEREGTPPRPVATPPVITVKKGEPARFHCDANSETPAEVHWTFGPDRGPLRGDVYQEGDDIIIDSSDDTNSGEYHCTATNAYGTGNAEPVRLVVTDNEEPPTARVEPRVFNGKPGDKHQFKCHTSGLPPPQVSWTGPGGAALPEGVVDLGGGVLEITDAQKEHEGDYTCHAVNIVGEATDHGTVHLGPSLTVRTHPSGPRIILTVGEPLEIRCEAIGSKGDPDPEVEWLHDPGPERGDLPDDFKPVTISEQFIRHPSIGLLNAGKYTCKGSNAQATATKDIYIEVVEPSHVATVSILGGSNQWFTLNQPAQLVCAATGPLLVDKVEWARIDGSLPVDVEDHNEQGLLHFGTFQPSYAGEYECRGYRKGELIGSSKVTVHPDDGTANDIARVEISPPRIRVVNEGDSIIMNCNVKGSKNPRTLTWKHYYRPSKKSHTKRPKITIISDTAVAGKKKKVIELQDIIGSGKYLPLTNVRPEMSGLYTVIANFTDDSSAIAEPAWVVVKPRGFDGEVKYDWSLARGGNLVRQLGSEKELVIKKADPTNDYGVYRCEVEDPDSKVIGTAFSAVTVGYSTPQKAEIAKFEEATDAELVCPVYAVPGATVSWTRNGDELPSNAQPRGNKLHITEFDDTTSGVYTCTVQIDQNTIQGFVDARIFVPDTTIKVVLNVSSENVAVGERVWLDCTVIGDPDATIEYSKDGSDKLPTGAQVTGSRLLFNAVKEEDTGTYQCKAHTSEGTLVTTAVINVGNGKRKRKNSNRRRARRRHHRRHNSGSANNNNKSLSREDSSASSSSSARHHRALRKEHHKNAVFGDWFKST
uniref:Ig-like domain-containing protein n=1 Tax=Panagrolaimus sp. PS1159 TaxID=55785 RepID=A0AC35GUF6_9BILA